MPFKVVSVKNFTYRGKSEDWSNGYIFDGAVPADPAAWDALFDAIWNAEKPCLHTSVRRVRMYGYAGLVPPAVRGKSFDPAAAGNVGTASNIAGAVQLSGDAAIVVRFRVGQNAKGRPRYVMKYYHGNQTTVADTVNSIVSAAFVTNLAALRDGTLPGGVKLCAPDGTLAGVPEVKPFITTRTLKRRGKRPTRA